MTVYPDFATACQFSIDIFRMYDHISKRRFIKNKVYANLSFMESADVYYAIKQFIPTRFSINNNPGYDDEPAPVYANVTQEKEPLLIERFIKFEFDIKGGKKYYLCLADCGMGKTTFLINLYYRILKQGKYQCKFISLQDSSCLKLIKKIPEKGKTILLLDALDENDNALTNYNTFMEQLMEETQDFYRVVITSRTNFFEGEAKEYLSERKGTNGTSSKLPELRKFYITPFTDEDIQHFLRIRYRFKRKKQIQSWRIISQNKNLSVRPLLLRFMDELLADGKTFEYDFQLYECLFLKWIDREKKSLKDEKGEELYKECQQMAKSIYYQWMKNGRIGIYLSELTENASVHGLKAIQLKGHAMLNRTKDGLYKFSHKSYWEYMLAKLALSDMYFASELTIKNFERALSFLEEMIQYYQIHEDEQTPKICISIAIYLMKYKKIEDAEKQCRKAITMCADRKHTRLLALVVLAECLHRQFKYKSEEMVLVDCQMLITEITLTKESLLLYTQFGTVFALFCRKMHLKDGQDFLQQVIEFCNANNIKNYSLLRCYDSYCNCCINLYLKQQAMSHMEDLIRENFQNDQYAIYLRDRAQSWKLSYSDQEAYRILHKMVESNMRFMDLYEQIVIISDLGISCAGINSRNWDLWNDMITERFADAWDICCLIYTENTVGEINNPYAMRVYKKLVLAYEKMDAGGFEESKKKMRENIDMVLLYIDKLNLQDEMWVEQIYLLDFIIMNEMGSFIQMEQVAYNQLEIAKNYGRDYDLVIVNWSHFLFYDSHAETKNLGQQYLKCAYDLAMRSDDFYMTTNYCVLLKVVLDNYVEEIDKARIAQELVEITPKIFGGDTRRSRIYRGLQKFFSSNNDAREMDTCYELLCCKFSYDGLKCYYDSCVKYQNSKIFLEKLNLICFEKGILSRDKLSSLNEFIEKSRDEMEIDFIQHLEMIHKRMKSVQRTNNFNLV